MISPFNLNDFSIGESQNPPEDTLFFAAPKDPAQYQKDLFAMKVIQYPNPPTVEKNESNLKHYYQYVRLAYLLKPEGYARSGNKLFIFMEKMKCDMREVLKNRMSKGQPFTIEEIKVFIKHTTLALEELEKKSFPHLNIKPTNILQTMKGMYKISDVGIESTKDDDDYKAPELMGFHQKNMNFNLHKADVFSLGLVILQLITLKSTKEIQVFKTNIPDGYRNIEEIYNDVKVRYGKSLYKIIKDMLVLSDTSRKTIIQMKEDLEEFYVIFSIF